MRGFRQFSAHRTKCHDCHGICTLSPLDAALPIRFAKNTQHDTSKVLRLPRKMTMDTSKVLRLPRELQHIFWKRRKSIAPATQNDFRHVAEHVWMSRSATPATRNEATTRLKLPKRTTSAKLPIGTAIRGSRGRLRTVATVNATSSEHTLNPRPPEWNGNPCYAFGNDLNNDQNMTKNNTTKQEWQKMQNQMTKNDQKKTKKIRQQPSEFAGKIFIMPTYSQKVGTFINHHFFDVRSAFLMRLMEARDLRPQRASFVHLLELLELLRHWLRRILPWQTKAQPRWIPLDVGMGSRKGGNKLCLKLGACLKGKLREATEITSKRKVFPEKIYVLKNNSGITCF